MKYLLLGLGLANNSVKKYFDKHGMDYVFYDDFIEEYKNIPIDYDVIVKSSGISNEHFLLKKYPEEKIITDLELFYNFNKDKKFITVTGTNGKTTTVSLIKSIIGPYVDLAGNIGYPLFDYVESKKDIIIEASSFMLEYVKDFRSKISILLNISWNHLEHHKTFDNYLEAKANIFNNNLDSDYVIYNYDDLNVRKIAMYSKGVKIPISLLKNVSGCYLKDNYIYYQRRAIISIDEIKLKGEHNLYNIMAAIVASSLYGINLYSIRDKIKKFVTLEHRIEFFCTINGVNVYNDSKATNIKAMKCSLDTFKGKRVLLICGGKFKDDIYNILDDSINDIVQVRVSGENKYLVKEYFISKGKEVIMYDKFEDVVNDINFESVDVILFSPGAVSYDMFSNYEERGKVFKQLILNLKDSFKG